MLVRMSQCTCRIYWVYIMCVSEVHHKCHITLSKNAKTNPTFRAHQNNSVDMMIRFYI